MSRASRIFTLTPELRDMLRKDAAAHKYHHGHALILSGGAGRSGAARLAARGALRVGAGLVTLAVPSDAMAEVASQVTAIMLGEAGTLAALEALLEDPRLNALCVGPGCGHGALEAAKLDAVLQAARKTVLDADALTLLAGDRALMARLHPACVMTPHAGEFARVFPDLAVNLNDGGNARIEAVRAAAQRAGCVVLLKGPETLVASPDGAVTAHPAAQDGSLAWLATAGSGDVLAGVIVGLMARGISPRMAANIGVWLHGQAARRFGPGLIAEDLPETLPAVFRELGL